MEKLDAKQFFRENFPIYLAQQVASYKWEEILIGCSGSYVFRLYHDNIPSDRQTDMYLKIVEKEKTESLILEQERLSWLQGKLSVPQILHFTEDSWYEYMLISEIPGLFSCHSSFKDNIPHIASLLASGLREIHNVDIGQCPFDQTLSRKVKNAQRRVQLGLVDEGDFDEKRLGRKAEEVFTELVATRPVNEELVFTHGDYCLPNIIIDQGKVSGFIDWGRSGVADKYQDLALAVRSLASNFGAEYVPAFFKAYGLERVDQAKIEFYQLLDEFF